MFVEVDLSVCDEDLFLVFEEDELDGMLNVGENGGFLSAAERIFVGEERALLNGPVGIPFS